MLVCYRLSVSIVVLRGTPHPSCEICREASQLPLCTPHRIPASAVLYLRLDIWNILLRARRKRMWRKQRREEAASTMTDAIVKTADGPLRDSLSAVPYMHSVPPSQGKEDIVTQDIRVASQSEAHFPDVSDASDKPTHMSVVESTGIYYVRRGRGSLRVRL